MIKYKLFISFLLFFIFLITVSLYSLEIVAEVAGEQISWFDLQKRYEILWRDYLRDKNKYPHISEESFQKELQELALKQLINEKLFQVYAKENDISINQTELETIFKEIYSDNELFTTFGVFDEKKFQDFKNEHPKRYKQILSKIRNDFFYEKIKGIIKEKFALTDKQLYAEFIKDNSRIKLEYIIIPDSLMPYTFPSTPCYLKKFYQHHKRDYKAPRKVKIRLIYINEDLFLPSTMSYQKYIPQYKAEAHKVAKQYSQLLIEDFNSSYRKGGEIEFWDHHPIETNYLTKGDKIGMLLNGENIVKFALNQREGKFFPHPIEQENGWIIFQTLDIREKGYAKLFELPMIVWKDYIQNGENVYYDYESNKYYNLNIKNEIIFQVDISYIYFDKDSIEFDIQFSPDSIESYYKKNIEEFVTVRDTLPLEKVEEDILETLQKEQEKILLDSLIDSLCTEVKNDNFEIIYPSISIRYYQKYIKNLPYYKEPFPTISDTLFKTSVDSIFKVVKDDKVIIGRVNDKDYISILDKDKLKLIINQLFKDKFYYNNQKDFQEYYNKIKQKLRKKDLFKFSYFYCPVDTSLVEISEKQAYNYFVENQQQFIIPEKIKYEAIYLKQSPHLKDTIIEIIAALKDSVDFSILTKIFFNPHKITYNNNEFINSSIIPKDIRNEIDNLLVGEISEPIHTADGCFIIKLLARKSLSKPEFRDVKDDIIYELKYQRADSLTIINLVSLYDSLESEADLRKFCDSSFVYTTDYISIHNDSIVLDSNVVIKKQFFEVLNRTYPGKKIPNILPANNGYSIVFVTGKIPGRKITGYESYSLAKDKFIKHKKYQEGRIFTDYLINLAKIGDDDLLQVFGGMKATNWLSYSDQINDLQNSPIILKDAFSKTTGTYSHPIRFSRNSFGFYHILDKEVGTIKNFNEIKDEYRKNFMENKFSEWLEAYNIKKGVKILND